jgi:adiponectin receptor
VQDGLHSLQQGLSDNLHALEDRLSGMQQGLTHNLQALEGRMQQGVAAIEEGMASRVQAGVAALATELPSMLKQLPGSIQAGGQQLGAALGTHLRQQLRPVLQWPTPRWPVYVYLAGAMACLATSTAAHVFGCCQQHISDLMW